MKHNIFSVKTMGLAMLFLGLLYGSPSMAAGQVGASTPPGRAALSYGSLKLGQSSKTQVEAYFSESLDCAAIAPTKEGRRAHLCRSSKLDSSNRLEVFLVEGRLSAIRFFLPEDIDAQRAVYILENTYGRMIYVNPGDIHTGGLRYWTFDVNPYKMTLSEARNTQTGDVRLRLYMSEGTDREYSPQ